MFIDTDAATAVQVMMEGRCEPPQIVITSNHYNVYPINGFPV